MNPLQVMKSLLREEKRASKETFPLNESTAADEELVAMKRRQPWKQTFPLKEAAAADEELAAMK